MNLAEELTRVEAARQGAESALADLESPLALAQLRVMVAQSLIGATGFQLAQSDLPPGDHAARLRTAFADADRANWALIEALRAARGAAGG